jgi:hypothetical protein
MADAFKSMREMEGKFNEIKKEVKIKMDKAT